MRKVFFSFEYSDVSRAMIVRQSWVTHGTQTAAGFIDKAEFEEVEKKGDAAIKRWIKEQMNGTSVTVVLVGAKTNKSKWVKFEIAESISRGNGLLEIDISKIKGFQGVTTSFCEWMLPSKYSGYGWVKDNGYENLGDWIEKAAKAAGK